MTPNTRFPGRTAAASHGPGSPRRAMRMATAGVATALVLGALAAAGPAHASASATLTNRDGETVGTVTLQETANGVLLRAEFDGLPPGTHGFHIHETGLCTPDFSAAGGHFAGGGESHGFIVATGPHAGDLPNIHVPESGRLTVEMFNDRITLDAGQGAIREGDGSAIIVHAGADDYESQPSGDAGERIACGVIVDVD